MAKSQADQLLGSEAVEDGDIPQAVAQRAVWSSTVDIPTDQLQIPYLTLVQANSRAVSDEIAKMGQWLVEGYPPENNVILVPLQFGLSRRYSIDKEGDIKTACYAPTGTPHGIALEPEGPGMECADCPLAQWTPTGKVKANGMAENSPPLCKESYDFMCWSATHEIPVRVGFRSTGLKAGRLVATLGKTKGLGNFAINLSSKKETGRQIYAVPVVMALTPEEAEDYLSTAQAIAAVSSGN